ncbi:toxin-antitoxin system YwqK family antitoxin [Pontibacter burrus]|uniref:Uncharacterized protein n=1 Tax=Pontibacter burrus TaxID=2704466 RepID=A0A6B3LPW5_9BACT|nr:hypothetical protein [Pontibacter burrus]NEM97893.1 hypothetical protein [Pontibacter burrus]
MLSPRALITLLLVICAIVNSPAQKLTKKQHYKNGISEKYFVLKSDKSVKHGQYLRTYNDVWFKDYIIDFGEYSNNQKTGKWYEFYAKDPNNFLRATGEFSNDKKEGWWQLFYLENSADIAISLGSQKITAIIEPRKSSDKYNITIDTTRLKKESEGNYSNGSKTGIWSYFDVDGALIHQYDHSSKKLVAINYTLSPTAYVLYLGNGDRFLNYYRAAQQDIQLTNSKPPVITKPSEVVFEASDDGTYKQISGFGDQQFMAHVTRIVQSIPQEWVYLDKENPQRVHLVFTAEYPAIPNKPTFNISLR